MALQTIGLGSSANDGSGDTLRAAGTKINANTGEIYARFGSGSGNGATLETATSANILVGNGTKFASVATSGDFNISSAGAINVRTDSSGVSKITIPSGSAPGTTTNTLYNIGGALYFNGAVVGSGNVTGMTAFSVNSNGAGSASSSITQGNTLNLNGGTGITAVSANNDVVTFSIDNTVVATLTGTQTLTNKTLTSPVLGGTTTTASGNLIVDPATQILEVKGDGSSTEGGIQLNCRVNTHGQKILAQPHSEGVTNTMLLPKGANSTLVSEVSTSTLTNKTIDANGTGNSITNLEVADFAAASIITQSEGISSNNNDTTIPTSAAVKAYADSVGGGGGGSTIVVQDEGSALSTNATTLNFVGAGVTASGTGAVKTVTVNAGVSTLAALTDTAITSAAAGNILLHDGSDSFDNKVVKSNDITLAHTAALAIPMGGFTFGPISADGTSHYVFANYTSGGANSPDPHLYLLSDMAYIFDLSGLGGAHPFQIESGGSALTTSNGADGLIHIATNGTVSTGTSANAKTSGLLIWKVPHFTAASTGTYTYQCTSHSGMQGAITIKTLETIT
ncbi:MAG: hypothetical protein CMD25_07885 [Flavobacteriales bacterium]|nr:hypothetical protein [Flavobacteriales bacterium]